MALSRAIEQAVKKEGFTFVEAISPCPTHHVGRAAFDGIEALYDDLERRCKTAEELASLPEDKRNEYILIGEFTK